MLPFLDQKAKSASMSHVVQRQPDESMEPDDTNHALLSAAEDLITAIHAKDAQAVAQAIKAACELCDDDSIKEQGE